MLWTYLFRQALTRLHGPPPTGPWDAATGLVVVADGVGGLDLCATGLCHVAARAGLPYAIQVVRWGHGPGRWYRDLTRTDRHAEQAAVIAGAVESFRDRRPGVPVFLVAKSGGSALIVRALEQLPPASVEAAVLIAPALSPRYDLSAALRAVRRDLTAFTSPLDVIVLGAGTWLFGTADRVRAPSAGLVGFKPPPGSDPEAYARLRQVPWRPRMARTGYLGGHVGPDLPPFLRAYVLPLLMSGPLLDSSVVRAEA